jgi:hypothetical protein
MAMPGRSPVKRGRRMPAPILPLSDCHRLKLALAGMAKM